MRLDNVQYPEPLARPLDPHAAFVEEDVSVWTGQERFTSRRQYIGTD